jgi:hypothetical protein
MRLDVREFGIAAGLTAAVLFILCATAVAISPGSTTSVASFLIHMDLSGMSRSITWGSFLGGLVAWTVGTGLTFALAGWLYNRFAGQAPR